MSAKIAGMVWDLDLPRMETHILLAMADHADHEGGHVFPSQALIAWKTGYSKRQVQRVQESLKQRKILIPEGSGYRGVLHYRLDFSHAPLKPPFSTSDKMTIDKMSPVKKHHVNKSLQPTSDKMSIETSDTMAIDKMSTVDISDTTSDIFDTSHNNDARAEPSLEPSVKDTTSNVPGSSAETPTTEDTPKKASRPRPESQQPGELHPNTVTAIMGMVVEPFHCLAKPTKLNERFWDAQIKLIQGVGVIDFQSCINSVDAYYSATPQKSPFSDQSARARMSFGIKYAMKEAQKTISGRRRYAN